MRGGTRIISVYADEWGQFWAAWIATFTSGWCSGRNEDRDATVIPESTGELNDCFFRNRQLHSWTSRGSSRDKNNVYVGGTSFSVNVHEIVLPRWREQTVSEQIVFVFLLVSTNSPWISVAIPSPSNNLTFFFASFAQIFASFAVKILNRKERKGCAKYAKNITFMARRSICTVLLKQDNQKRYHDESQNLIPLVTKDFRPPF